MGGPCALGNAQFELRLSGAGSSINLASVMFADSSVPCGPCTIQSDPVSFLFAPGLAGNAVLPLPIPCDTTLIGAEVFTQWASLLTGSTPCLLLPPSLGISFSNRVKATIAP